MKINVVCIYWFLLLVSFISSCLLFILVASEAVPAALIEDAINKSESGRGHVYSTQEETETTVNQEADIRSSFEEVTQEIKQTDANHGALTYAEHSSQNSGVSDGFAETGQAVVFTLVDTASAELQQRAEASEARTPPEEESNKTQHLRVLIPGGSVENKTEDDPSVQYVVRAEPKKISKEVPVEETNSTEYQTASVALPPVVVVKLNETDETVRKEEEDIPSFSEWTQKQLEEAEKKKEKVNMSIHSHHITKPTSNLKLRSKNYASPDCGAKIVAANPEAKSAGSVLSPSRDEYKLNTCTSKIWFVVELCEAIQAKKIDLANFELFSSSPKDFMVSVSDRFPTREWSSVGHFTAKDEKDIQSFNLHPHLFGKFIKVEVLSHYGSEHFCPISLFRVYGTSEFEVLQTEDQAHQNIIDDDDDDDDDEMLNSNEGEPSHNLFGSARDAVMSIVKKAAEALVNSGDGNKTDQNDASVLNRSATVTDKRCTSPTHLVVCDNCSDTLFGDVYDLLSCQRGFLQYLIRVPIIQDSFYNTNICSDYGLNICKKNNSSTYVLNVFPPKYVAALCNILAVQDNKVVLNVSNHYSNTSSVNLTTIPNDFVQLDTESEARLLHPSCPKDKDMQLETCASETSDEPEDNTPVIKVEGSIDASEMEQIKPTRTLRDDKADASHAVPTQEPGTSANEINLVPSESVDMPQKSTDSYTTHDTTTLSDNDIKSSEEPINYLQTSDINVPAESVENFEMVPEQFDNLLSELEDSAVTTASTPPSTVPHQQQKESVFLRLSNRIKALERNMSLSGQYLEELSRRYKKQVEEMQRAFEKKLLILYEENKKSDERAIQMQEQLVTLTTTLETLVSDKDSVWKTASLLGQFLLIEICITSILLYFCWRSPEPKTVPIKPKKQKSVVLLKRRKSIDVIHESPSVHRRRRPSEETLRLSGNYDDLLIVDPDEVGSLGLSRAEKRRRRKKNALIRSGSSVSYSEAMRRASSSDVPRRVFQRQESAPPRHSVFVNGDVTPPNRIEEIPFPLEESEHVPGATNYYGDGILPQQNSVDGDAFKQSQNGSVKSTVSKLPRISSPLFMMTALSSRSKRNSTSKSLQIFKTDKLDKNSSGIVDSSQRSSPELSKSNVSDCQDDESSINSDTMRKEKKSGGFRRIFKKVFE